MSRPGPGDSLVEGRRLKLGEFDKQPKRNVLRASRFSSSIFDQKLARRPRLNVGPALHKPKARAQFAPRPTGFVESLIGSITINTAVLGLTRAWIQIRETRAHQF